MRPTLRMAREADLQMLFMWDLNLRWLSRAMPKSRATGIATPLTDMSGNGSHWVNRDERLTISVLLGLHASLLAVHQINTSLTHSANLESAEGRSMELTVTYSWLLSAYVIQSIPCSLIRSSNGAKYKENKSGPRSEPCGTPCCSLLLEDTVFLTTTDCVLSVRYDRNYANTAPPNP